MKHLVIAAATKFEIYPLLKMYKAEASMHFVKNDIRVSFLITGAGIAQATYHTLEFLLKNIKTSLLVNVGITGAYDTSISLGEGVIVRADRFSDLGVSEESQFINSHELPFTRNSEQPFSHGGWLYDSKITFKCLSKLKEVNGVTSDTIHADKESINRIKKDFKPEIESMEGAAVAYVAAMRKVKFMQIRTVSNYVGPRNKEEWESENAVANLSLHLSNLIEEYCNEN